MTTRAVNIRVPTLARVEGEGALELDIEDGELTRVHLRIYEPPRFFESLLRGRSYRELPDLLARICGICPVAYQLTAVQAIERAFGITVPDTAAALRSVLYCGEWIQSHSLHIHLLAIPDFLGHESALTMGEEHGEILQRGFRLQNLGNRLMTWLGGRSVHPVNICTGGLYGAPDWRQTDAILTLLEEAWQDSAALIEWLLTLDLPDSELDCPAVHLWDGATYPLATGPIQLGSGPLVHPENYLDHVRELQVAHSTALQALLDGKPYMVGPLARINAGAHLLRSEVLAPLSGNTIRFPSRNPFHAVLARAVEIRHCIDVARQHLESVDTQSALAVSVSTRAATGAAATEAPRGLLWQQFSFAADGTVEKARIIPPTSQNQACMELDLRQSLSAHGLDREPDDLRRHAEQVIRNYDPCISCATHFLDLRVTRNGRPGRSCAEEPASAENPAQSMEKWRI